MCKGGKVVIDNVKISVVIPSYKVDEHIENVIENIPNFVNNIIVVDDKCPQNSGKIAENLDDKRVIVCYHNENLGVGGGGSHWIQKGIRIRY